VSTGPQAINVVKAFTSPGSIRLTSLPPLALYVHFPWCVRKCPYCDFNSHEWKGDSFPEDRYLDALRADLERALPLVWGRQVHTVFIGGGTPSLLSAKGLDRRPVVEFVQAGFVARNCAAKSRDEPGAVAQVVSVREHDQLGRANRVDRIEPLGRRHRVDQSRDLGQVVGADVEADSLVERGPVEDARPDLVHRGHCNAVSAASRGHEPGAAKLATTATKLI